MVNIAKCRRLVLGRRTCGSLKFDIEAFSEAVLTVFWHQQRSGCSVQSLALYAREHLGYLPDVNEF